MNLKVAYLKKNLPEICSKDGDSGYDLRAAIDETIVIPAFGIATVPTGIALELTDYPTENNMSVEIQIRPRSGMTKNGIVAQLGTVDVSYRGELKVNIYNFNNHPVDIQPLDRIAQIVICPIYKPKVTKVDALSETERGTKGFGSSGIR